MYANANRRSLSPWRPARSGPSWFARVQNKLSDLNDYNDMMALDDRMLKDIGVTRDQVRSARIETRRSLFV